MLPEHIKEAIDRYVSDHTPVGGFLTAVLSNNLSGALNKADDGNRLALFDIVKHCWNELPGGCWGSPKAVTAWLASRQSTTPQEKP